MARTVRGESRGTLTLVVVYNVYVSPQVLPSKAFSEVKYSRSITLEPDFVHGLGLSLSF
jgi:hypothetical protein